MSYSYTTAETQTFTITHAKHMAAKVATDLKRLQRFYSTNVTTPSDKRIAEFETEIIELLKAGYLKNVTYGFMRNEEWIVPTLRYTSEDLAGANANDDDPGRVVPNANIEGAFFHSYLIYSSSWYLLTEEEKNKFEGNLPFRRVGASEPGTSGSFSPDKTYSSGGRALDRSSLKN
jgi:hypothetical protein